MEVLLEESEFTQDKTMSSDESTIHRSNIKTCNMSTVKKSLHQY